METLFAIGVGAYGVTTAGYLASLWSRGERLAWSATWLLRGTLLLWAGLLGWWASTGQTGVHLYLGVSAWSLGVLYLVLLRRYPISALGSFISALATILAVLAILVSRTTELVSAQSAPTLLRIHIGLAFVGITAFGFSSAVSMVYAIHSWQLKSKRRGRIGRRLPPLAVLDRLALRGILFGFPFYTLALLLGSAQAVRLGDGKIRIAYVLATVSWAIYAGVLQARLAAGWRGRKAAYLTFIGFIVSLVVVGLYSFGGT